jgi:hypothetical protein
MRCSDVRKDFGSGATQVAWAIGKIESIRPKLYDALQIRFNRLLSRSGVGSGAKIKGPLTGRVNRPYPSEPLSYGLKKRSNSSSSCLLSEARTRMWRTMVPEMRGEKPSGVL